MKIIAFLACFTAGLMFALTGCSPSAPVSPKVNPSATPAEQPHDEHAGHDHSQSDMEKMKAEMAKLSREDAASAASQHVCPVSGEMLGTMGAPQKVDVNGHDVWICCDGCKDKLLANPDEYLAKLKQE